MEKKGENGEDKVVVKTDKVSRINFTREELLTIIRGASFTITPEQRMRMIGFDNMNCFNRYVRRMKRKKEQERRRRLKEGSDHA